jgi:hypothetical protein
MHSSWHTRHNTSQNTQKSKNFRPIISQSHPHKEIDANTEISDSNHCETAKCTAVETQGTAVAKIPKNREIFAQSFHNHIPKKKSTQTQKSATQDTTCPYTAQNSIHSN